MEVVKVGISGVLSVCYEFVVALEASVSNKPLPNATLEMISR